MSKLNPFFEVDGKKYEIMRTRAVECQYDKIREQNKLDDEQVSVTNDYAKLAVEYEEILTKYSEAKEAYMCDEGILDENKKKKYLAYKELADNKYNEVKEFELKNKNFSLNEIEDVAYKNGVELLIFALEEQCNVSKDEAIALWEGFVEQLGLNTAKEWITLMLQTLFEREDEEQNPFMKQARARQQQKMEQRKGLSKMRK